MRIRYLGLAMACGLALGICIAADRTAAAPTTGMIRATVTDEAGNSIPGVLVSLSPVPGKASGEGRVQVSNEKGQVRFLTPELGCWKITFSLDGFSTVTRTVCVRDGRPITLAATLEPATQVEELIVPARSPTVPVATGQPTNGNSGGFTVELNGGAAFYNFPVQGYLGKELQGSNNPQLGLVTPDRRVTGSAQSFVFTYEPFRAGWSRTPLGSTSADRYFRFGINHSSANSNQRLGEFDPGANHRTLFPGPTGGASGFSLGGYPANIVTDMVNLQDYSQFGGFVEVGFDPFVIQHVPTGLFVSGAGSSTTVQPFVRVAVAKDDLTQTFSGDIPGFASSFAYNTNVDVTKVGVVAGVDGRTPLFSIPHVPTGLFVNNSPAPDDMWSVALRWAGEIGAFRVSGSGTDSLDFTGGVNASSTQSLDASETSLYYKVTGGIELTSPGKSATAFLYTSYEQQPGFSVIERDGTNPSHLKFKSVDIWTVKAGVNIGFDPNALVASDIRLKRDIVKVGSLPSGLALYRYRYLWSDTQYVGVMAQEVQRVMPQAVVRGADGWLRVNYGKLGTRLMTWAKWNASRKKLAGAVH